MKGNRPDDSTCIRRDKVVYTRRAYLAIRRSPPFLLPSSSSPHCPFLPISQHRSRHRDKGRRGQLVGGCVYAIPLPGWSSPFSNQLAVPLVFSSTLIKRPSSLLGEIYWRGEFARSLFDRRGKARTMESSLSLFPSLPSFSSK